MDDRTSYIVTGVFLCLLGGMLWPVGLLTIPAGAVCIFVGVNPKELHEESK